MISKKVKWGIFILSGLSIIVNGIWCTQKIIEHLEEKGAQVIVDVLKPSLDKDGKALDGSKILFEVLDKSGHLDEKKIKDYEDSKLIEARQQGIQIALLQIKGAIDKEGKVSLPVQGKDGQPEQLVLEKKVK